jgi:hypothetical protein
MGAPVIWPQQQDMPVYHNRAIWPFVTAYGLKAAIGPQRGRGRCRLRYADARRGR